MLLVQWVGVVRNQTVNFGVPWRTVYRFSHRSEYRTRRNVAQIFILGKWKYTRWVAVAFLSYKVSTVKTRDTSRWHRKKDEYLISVLIQAFSLTDSHALCPGNSRNFTSCRISASWKIRRRKLTRSQKANFKALDRHHGKSRQERKISLEQTILTEMSDKENAEWPFNSIEKGSSSSLQLKNDPGSE